ncbi:SIMPL domain-containing protein [Colwellia piezophila]|uniref:SIMPL domain-containing protein n=1 Tax=Colwellia piezophila TaxID=211668 RepID=UPI00036D720E|nr:SIMPL domain-containing protein [Colwellia piezophila]
MKFFGLIIFFCISCYGTAATIPDFPFVTVTGESTSKVKPNIVNIEFSILTFDKESNKANQLHQQTVGRLVEELKILGVIPEDISSFEVNKRTTRDRDDRYNELSILGYEVSQSFNVHLNNLSVYSEITKLLLNTNNVENINSEFDTTKRQSIEAQLIKKAGQNAKEKAQQMALGLDVKIDSVFAFNDTGSFSSFFATFGLNSGRIRFVAEQRRRVPPSTLFIPQFIEISKSINVVYRLEN